MQILNPNWESLQEKIDSGINYMKQVSKKKIQKPRGRVGRGIEI